MLSGTHPLPPVQDADDAGDEADGADEHGARDEDESRRRREQLHDPPAKHAVQRN